MSTARARHSWTVTPVQVVLGRRIGFRHHWRYWAASLALMYAVGVVKGIQMGRERHPQRSRGTA